MMASTTPVMEVTSAASVPATCCADCINATVVEAMDAAPVIRGCDCTASVTTWATVVAATRTPSTILVSPHASEVVTLADAGRAALAICQLIERVTRRLIDAIGSLGKLQILRLLENVERQ